MLIIHQALFSSRCISAKFKQPYISRAKFILSLLKIDKDLLRRLLFQKRCSYVLLSTAPQEEDPSAYKPIHTLRLRVIPVLGMVSCAGSLLLPIV